METQTERAAREVESKQRRDRDFQRFMAKPEVKLLVSQIPATNPPETLETLLQMAFESGTGTGLGEVVEIMLQGMAREKPGGRF